MRIYHYVGPPDLAPGPHTPFHGQSIATASDFAAWREARTAGELREPLTYVIDAAVTLRLAPRQIEHVVCAGGNPVLGAGEISWNVASAADITDEGSPRPAPGGGPTGGS